MANTKKISVDWSETGLTVYAIIERKLDGYLLNDADGEFASAPADPYISFSEHSTIKGRYTKEESRVLWNDGWYRAYIYKQAGGSPSPMADTMVGAGDMLIELDLERDINSKMNLGVVRAIGLDTLGVTKILDRVGDDVAVADSVNAIKEQTDRMIFDTSNNIQTTNPFPTGLVVQDDINELLTFKTDLIETDDDYWVGAFLKFTSGNVINQVKKILSYNGTTKVFTFYAAFTNVPAAGSEFKIVNE